MSHTVIFGSHKIEFTANPMYEITGRKPQTTFWQDFCIADAFGASAIKDTYNRAFKEWKTNVKYVTELVLVLNHKCCMHYQLHHTDISQLYADLYETANEWCKDNLKGEDLEYFYEVTD